MASVLDLDRVGSIVDDLYRSVEERPLWTAALARLGELLRVRCVGAQTFDLVRKEGRAAGIVAFPRASEDDYNAYYSKVNIWMGRARGRIAAGSLVVSDDLAAPDEVLRSEWYDGFLRPLGVLHSMGAVVGIEADVSTTIAFLRPAAEGPYTDAERRLLLPIVPHLQNVARLTARIETLQAVKSSLSSALDRLGHGVVVVAADGRVSFCNALAREILDRGDGLTLRPDGIRPRVAAQAAVLAQAIADAAGAPCGRAPRETLLRVTRTSGARPYELLVLPLPEGFSPPGAPARGAVVFVNDLEDSPPPAADRLGAAFSLTAREASLAALLARGADLESAAAELDVSRETARSHLKSIYLKTGTNRQAQLARLCLTSLSRMGPGVRAAASGARRTRAG